MERPFHLSGLNLNLNLNLTYFLGALSNLSNFKPFTR